MDRTTQSALLDRALNEGWLRTRGAEEMDCAGIEASHAGYYGSKGMLIYLFNNNGLRNWPTRCWENFDDSQYARQGLTHSRRYTKLSQAPLIRYCP